MPQPDRHEAICRKAGRSCSPGQGLTVQGLSGLQAEWPLPHSLASPPRGRISKAALCIEEPRSPSCAREEAGGGTPQMGGSQGSPDWRSQGPWPREDGAHMGGCFCIPGERSLPWGSGEFPEGIWPRAQSGKSAGPGKAQGVSALEKLFFQRLGEGCNFWLPLSPL